MLPAINCGKTLGGPISRQIPVYRIATNDRIDPALTYARPMSSPSFFDNAYRLHRRLRVRLVDRYVRGAHISVPPVRPPHLVAENSVHLHARREHHMVHPLRPARLHHVKSPRHMFENPDAKLSVVAPSVGKFPR